MQAAKIQRAEQLRRLEQYLSGEETEYKSMQGKVYTEVYDPEIYNKARTPHKLTFAKIAILLDAAATQDSDLVEQMLKDGLDPDSCNSDGLTALHQCCIENCLKIASLLAQHGADVNKKDGDWWTPLHAAAACGNWRIVNFLINHGANLKDVNADGDLAVDLAEGDKTIGILESEMERLGVSDDTGMEACRTKPEEEFTEVVKKMIAENAKAINETYEHGAYPVHIAASCGYIGALQLLIDNKADLDVQDDEGETPLHLGAIFQNYKVVELLAKSGADPGVKNRHDQIPSVLTEDTTMIRLFKAMKEKTRLPSMIGEDIEKSMRDRGKSISKKMTTMQKKEFGKMDVRAEFAKFAELDQQSGKKSGHLLSNDDQDNGKDKKAVAAAKDGKKITKDGKQDAIAARYAKQIMEANQTHRDSATPTVPDDGPASATTTTTTTTTTKEKGGCCVIS